MSLIKISLLSMFTLCLISAQAARFDIVNQCGYTVWPAATPSGGGRQLDQGQTWTLDIPAGTSSGRIWGRTGCTFDGSGNGNCQTGDCGGALSCRLLLPNSHLTVIAVVPSGSGNCQTGPLTLTEFTLNGENNLDYIDLSVIDGFNIPMQLSSTSNGCNKVLNCGDSNCPDAYHQPNDVKTNTCPGGTNYKVVFCP